jgi:hypothetical protein
MSDGPIKVMIPEPLPAGVSREQFKDRWQELADAAMKLPLWRNVQGYAHHHIVDLDATGLRGNAAAESMAPDTYGGVAVTDFANREALASFLDDPSYAQLAEQYEKTMGESPGARMESGKYSVGVPQLMFEKGGPDQLKMFAFLRRVDELTREQYLHDWHAFASANFVVNEAIVAELLAYYQVHALTNDDIAANGFDGTIILRFAEPANFPRWIEAGSTMAASPTFFVQEKSIFLLATEQKLYEA